MDASRALHGGGLGRVAFQPGDLVPRPRSVPPQACRALEWQLDTPDARWVRSRASQRGSVLMWSRCYWRQVAFRLTWVNAAASLSAGAPPPTPVRRAPRACPAHVSREPSRTCRTSQSAPRSSVRTPRGARGPRPPAQRVAHQLGGVFDFALGAPQRARRRRLRHGNRARRLRLKLGDTTFLTEAGEPARRACELAHGVLKAATEVDRTPAGAAPARSVQHVHRAPGGLADNTHKGGNDYPRG